MTSYYTPPTDRTFAVTLRKQKVT